MCMSKLFRLFKLTSNQTNPTPLTESKSSRALSVEDMLPRKFVLGPQRCYCLSIETENCPYSIDTHAFLVKIKFPTNDNKKYEIILHDPIVPNATLAVMEWIRESMEAVSQSKPIKPRKIRIDQLDPVGTVVKQTTINATLIHTDFGSLTHELEPAAEIVLTIEER